jgi:flagellum-specific ATP synthase
VLEDVVEREQVKCAVRVLSLLSVYQGIEDLVNIGAYVPGANLEYDLAVQARPKILHYLQQAPSDPCSLEGARTQLMDLAKWIEQLERALKAKVAKGSRSAARAAGVHA